MSRFAMAVVFAALASGAAVRAQDGPDVGYFLGESKTTTPDGKLLRTSLALVKRVVSRADSRIEEHVLSIGEKEAKAFVTVLDVTGARFTVSERSGAFTGEGELVGEAWRWREWKSVTRLTGGMGTVTSEDKITDQVLTAKKTFAGPDGKVVLRFEDSLRPISPKTYDILYQKLAPAGKK